MKTTQIIKKALCLFVSVLMLITSVPVASFAEWFPVKGVEVISHVDANGQEIIEKIVVHDEYALAEFVEKNGDNFLGPTVSAAKHARVTAEQVSKDEVRKVTTKLENGHLEVQDRLAKEGQWILTNPGGEQYIVDGTKFLKEYEPALELGEGFYKKKWLGACKLRQSSVPMDITKQSWGGYVQANKKNFWLRIDDPKDIYGVGEKEFNETYKFLEDIFKESVAELKAFLKQVKGKLPSKKRLYERFLKTGTVFSKKQIAQKAESVAKNIEGEVASKTGKVTKKGTRKITKAVIPAFATTGVGVLLYFGFSLLTVPSVQGQNPGGYATRGEIISDLRAQLGDDVEDVDEKSQMLRTMILVDTVDEDDLESYVINDTLNGGDLLDNLDEAAITAQAPGFTHEEAAEVIRQVVEEEAAEEAEQVETETTNRINRSYALPTVEIIP